MSICKVARREHTARHTIGGEERVGNRAAAGLAYVSYAAEHARGSLPWFAIGSIDAGNVAEVVAAGAERIVVVRAIRDADQPGTAARELRAALRTASPTEAPTG